MYCAKCGSEITGNQRFCGVCGEPVLDSSDITEPMKNTREDNSANNTRQDTPQDASRDANEDIYQAIYQGIHQDTYPDVYPDTDPDAYQETYPDDPYQFERDTVPGDGGINSPPFPPQTRKRAGGRNMGVIIAAAISAVVLVVAAFFIITAISGNRLNERYDTLLESIQDHNIPSADKACEDIKRQWKQASNWILSEKRDLVGELTELESESASAAETLDTYAQTLLDWKADMEQYHLNDDYNAYEAAVQSFSDAIDPGTRAWPSRRKTAPSKPLPG